MKTKTKDFRIISGGAAVGLLLALHATGAYAGVTVPAPASDVENTPPAPPAKPQDPLLEDHPIDGRFLAELNSRKAALDKREHDLDMREAKLAAAEILARKEIAQMTELRGEVEKLVVNETSGADSDLSLLAGLYSNMKPAQAAAILDKLDVPKAAAILRRLDSRMAGPVLAAMDPGLAAGVTQELGRVHAAFQQ
jgi:flagellar motility protein MotE (MotC chaperone)